MPGACWWRRFAGRPVVTVDQRIAQRVADLGDLVRQIVGPGDCVRGDRTDRRHRLRPHPVQGIIRIGQRAARTVHTCQRVVVVVVLRDLIAGSVGIDGLLQAIETVIDIIGLMRRGAVN